MNAIYGPRVDNRSDELILKTYVKMLIQPQSTHASLPNPPSTGQHKDYLSIISLQYPDTDTPSLYNLPYNSDKGLQRQTLIQLVKGFRMISGEVDRG